MTTNLQSELSKKFLQIRLILIPKQLKYLSLEPQPRPPLQYQQPSHYCRRPHLEIKISL